MYSYVLSKLLLIQPRWLSFHDVVGNVMDLLHPSWGVRSPAVLFIHFITNPRTKCMEAYKAPIIISISVTFTFTNFCDFLELSTYFSRYFCSVLYFIFQCTFFFHMKELYDTQIRTIFFFFFFFFYQVKLWPAWVGIETAIFWQSSPGTVDTQRLYPLLI